MSGGAPRLCKVLGQERTLDLVPVARIWASESMFQSMMAWEVRAELAAALSETEVTSTVTKARRTRRMIKLLCCCDARVRNAGRWAVSLLVVMRTFIPVNSRLRKDHGKGRHARAPAREHSRAHPRRASKGARRETKTCRPISLKMFTGDTP